MLEQCAPAHGGCAVMIAIQCRDLSLELRPIHWRCCMPAFLFFSEASDRSTAPAAGLSPLHSARPRPQPAGQQPPPPGNNALQQLCSTLPGLPQLGKMAGKCRMASVEAAAAAAPLAQLRLSANPRHHGQSSLRTSAPLRWPPFCHSGIWQYSPHCRATSARAGRQHMPAGPAVARPASTTAPVTSSAVPGRISACVLCLLPRHPRVFVPS